METGLLPSAKPGKYSHILHSPPLNRPVRRAYATAISRRQASGPLDASDDVFPNKSASISQPWAGMATDWPGAM